MMSMQSSTHSSQMNTVGPAMSLRTSCWLLPQNEQYSVFLVSPPLTLFISEPRQDTSHHSRNPAAQTRLTHDREGQPGASAKGGGAPPHQLSRKLLRILDRLGCFSFHGVFSLHLVFEFVECLIPTCCPRFSMALIDDINDWLVLVSYYFFFF